MTDTQSKLIQALKDLQADLAKSSFWEEQAELVGEAAAELETAYQEDGIRRDARAALEAAFTITKTTDRESRAEGDEFAPGECDGSGTCSAPVHVHGCYRPHRSDECDSPDEYGHTDREDGER